MLLQDAIDGFLMFRSTAVSDETCRIDRTVLKQFRRNLENPEADVGDISAVDIRNVLEYHKQRGLAKSSIERHYASLRAFFSWLADDEIEVIDRNPILRIQRPKRGEIKPKALSREQVEALINTAESTGYNRHRNASIVRFMLDSAVRATELCELTLDRADLKRGRALVEGKGSKQRYVYFGKRARLSTWKYVANNRPEPMQVDCENIWLTQTGYPMDRWTLYKLIANLADRAGFSASPHCLRHTASLAMLLSGAISLAGLSRTLGHSSIQTTMRYISGLQDEMVEESAHHASPCDNWRI